MTNETFSSVTVSRGSPAGSIDVVPTIVWVRGVHDVATRVHLSLTIAQAARLDDEDLVVDLSGVTFMDVSTVSALVVARNRLAERGRGLVVRAPSPRALRVIDLCGQQGLVDDAVPEPPPDGAKALGTWVDVPTPPPASATSTPEPHVAGRGTAAEHAPSGRAPRGDPAPRP